MALTGPLASHAFRSDRYGQVDDQIARYFSLALRDVGVRGEQRLFLQSAHRDGLRGSASWDDRISRRR